MKKISFLKKRKNINDKFFDLVERDIKKVPVKNKKGKFKGVTRWVYKGLNKLSKELEISPATTRRYIEIGRINENNDTLFINVERNFENLRKVKYREFRKNKRLDRYDYKPFEFTSKKTTKEFTIHNFTRDNFFRTKKFGRAKKNEQFYFRAGLYIVFERRNKAGRIKMRYVIQNFPVSHYSNSYKQGHNDFFDIIKIELQQYPSLKYFRFNYFDVQKIDISK